jgi:hypothetical protein
MWAVLYLNSSVVVISTISAITLNDAEEPWGCVFEYEYMSWSFLEMEQYRAASFWLGAEADPIDC